MRGLRTPFAAVAVLAAIAPAGAGELAVRVVGTEGRPVANAVVTLVPDRLSSVPLAAGPMPVIDQRNEAFLPLIQTVRTGEAVIFRNSDATRHHVYSFSPVKPFETELAPGETSAPVLFEKPGVAAIGCNIHDHMVAYVYVTEAPWTAQTGADGLAAFTALTEGRYLVRVWHPQLRPGTPEPAQPASVSASAPAKLSVTLALRPDQRRHGDRERSAY